MNRRNDISDKNCAEDIADQAELRRDNEVCLNKSSDQTISFNKKKEITRSDFTIDGEIGSGKFGLLHKGILTGLYGETSKTTVAIKSAHGFGKEDREDINNILIQIKILLNKCLLTHNFLF